MTEITEAGPKLVENYFGGCPHCGGTNGYLNVRSTHIFVCHTHKVGWYAGANLFSSWREESEADWKANQARIANYEEVEPLPMGAVVPGDPHLLQPSPQAKQ